MRAALAGIISAALMPACLLVAADKPRVSLELLTRGNLPLTAQQQWYKALSELGISGLRIHAAGPGDEMAIEERGRKGSGDYQVVGILASDNKLYLPGGKFAIGDTAKLRKWLDNLGSDGPSGVAEPRSAFGLTAGQLQRITDDLKTPVRFETKGMTASNAVGQIARGLHFSLDVDATARRALAAMKVENELNGLASGTALAAIARSAGLASSPSAWRGANSATGWPRPARGTRRGRWAGRRASAATSCCPTCSSGSTSR